MSSSFYCKVLKYLNKCEKLGTKSSTNKEVKLLIIQWTLEGDKQIGMEAVDNCEFISYTQYNIIILLSFTCFYSPTSFVIWVWDNILVCCILISEIISSTEKVAKH